MSVKYVKNIAVRVSVHVQEICLLVKFPCKAFFQLKNSQSVSPRSNLYELINGKCTPSEAIEIDAVIEQKDEIYSEKKIQLTIFVSSNSGELPTGHLSIPLVSENQIIGTDEPIKKNIYVQKCPDKSANITLSVSTKIGSISERIIKEASEKKAKLLTESQMCDSNQKERRDSIKNIKYSITNLVTSNIRKNFNANSEKREHSIKNSQKSIDSSQISENSSQKSHKVTNKNLRWSMHGVDSQKSHDSSSNLLVQKLKRLQKQKSDMRKQIMKLKADILNSKHTGSTISNEDLHILKEQLKQLKTKCFILQKNQRTLNQELKSKDQQINRITNSKEALEETHRIDIDKISMQKDKTINKWKDELQRSEKENEKLKIEVERLKKKSELKEGSYKQQLERLIRKNEQGDKERKKIMDNYNSSLQNYKENEKKKQMQEIKKQKQYEQKIKELTANKQQLIQEIQKINKQNTALKATLSTSTLHQSYHSEYLKKMQEKNKQLMQRQKQAEIQRVKETQKIRNLSIEVKKLQNFEAQSQNLAKELKQLTLLHTREQDEYKERIKQLQNYAAHHQQMIKKREKQNQEYIHQIRLLENQHALLLDQQKSKMIFNEERFLQGQQKQGQLLLELQKNKKEQYSMQSKIDKLLDELKKQSETSEKVYEELQRVKKILCEVKKQLSQKQEKIYELMQEQEIYRSKLEQTSKRVIDEVTRKQWNSEIDLYRIKIHEQEEQLSELVSKLKTLENQNQVIQLRLYHKQIQNEQLGEELKNCLQTWEAQKSPYLKNSQGRVPEEQIRWILKQIDRISAQKVYSN